MFIDVYISKDFMLVYALGYVDLQVYVHAMDNSNLRSKVFTGKTSVHVNGFKMNESFKFVYTLQWAHIRMYVYFRSDLRLVYSYV